MNDISLILISGGVSIYVLVYSSMYQKPEIKPVCCEHTPSINRLWATLKFIRYFSIK